ncbi:D-3-phosphoglycerate dehydrogenase [Microcella alkaliphila]|uniref:D-3-phosphoglycerate dehydrogenase n=1 Tax=Microcella alkaliphila TaxID=279828 RepID=A0A4Q7TGE4_9MICO|nr:NAD(P)-dependent oxidoreductase [Microcella alkaliphila]RZT59534.1 D-3-phosphoglycerate dehydrogenase [Microcella alkaliphila]
MATILATSRSFGDGDLDLARELEDAGHRILRGPSDHDFAFVARELADADAWVAGTGPVTAEHLDAAPNLRVVARYGVGFEAVDLEAAAVRGVWVTNTPGANSSAVAEHTIALMLTALRGVVDGDRRVRKGDWSTFRGRELGGLTVGIVGFGRIGRGVAQRLSGFGSRILAADPMITPQQLSDLGVEPSTLQHMASQCDVITLHAPGGDTLITAQWLDTIKRSCVIVNTARSDLVDEAALAAALELGRIAAYAADTLHGDTGGLPSPLLTPRLSPRVTITPHLGAQTVEAVDGMGSRAVENVLAVLAGDTPHDAVNTPDPDARAARDRAAARLDTTLKDTP